VSRILLFYPSNNRTVALETLTLAIHRRGVPIEVLTTCGPGPFHEFLSAHGVPTYAHPVTKGAPLLYYVRQILFLARFCRSHRITTVFSHLQHANLIAAFAQYLTPATVVLFRHHFRFVFPGDGIYVEPNRTERLFDIAINRLAGTIVVPSTGVYEGMRRLERVNMGRVRILPYVYDFEQYGRPNSDAVTAIRAQFPSRLTLLMSSRMVPLKRHALVFRVVQDLVREGLDVRLLVLDDGPERGALEDFVTGHGLGDRIIMLGFRSDFVDYMGAADLLVHPSLTEASSSVVKEMGVLGKTAIVCEGVGDFDEYLEDGRNAFLVPRATDGSEIAEVLRAVYADPACLAQLGQSLRDTVLDRFSVRPETVDRYLALADPTSRGPAPTP
jgi:glycosyltransferase involved in cell wall biosynthesis